MKHATTGLALPRGTLVHRALSNIGEIGLGRWLFETWRRRVVLPLISWPHRPMKGSELLIAELTGQLGLEIGGPSRFFRNGAQLPLYPVLSGLDNCNFSSDTVWEGALQEGVFSLDNRVVGHQYICEATEVSERLHDRRYDFVISSNCLEHVANPLKAVEAWLSVLRAEGRLIVVVPNKASNFDRLRSVTSFEHLKLDYRRDVGEDDRTHFDEVLECTDLRLTSKRAVGGIAEFRKMVMQNARLRCVHHHVFSAKLLCKIAEHFGLVDIQVTNVGTDFVLVARTANN